MIITLIGMPGSGKSSVGKVLAAALGFAFVDTDKVIEAAHGKRLQDVLDGMGGERFLSVEASAVVGSLRQSTVIAPGGSIVYSEDAMRKVSEASTVVYLRCSLSVLARRIGTRPRGIVGGVEKTLDQLYVERIPLYEKWALLTVDGNGRADAVAATVADTVRVRQNVRRV